MVKALEHILSEVEALPEAEQRRIAHVLEEEVRKARRMAGDGGRWARLAERLSRESPLEGKSEDLLRQAPEFREGFMMMEPEKAK